MSDKDYPLVTSDNNAGDTATQGFNTDVLESLDPVNRQIVSDVLGLQNTGKDIFYGSDFVHPEHVPVLAEALAKVTDGEKVNAHEIAHALVQAQKHVTNASWNRNAAPNLITTGGIFFPAPNGSSSSITVNQVLAYDPMRYRVTLHPWTPGTGTTAVIWIGKEQGDVAQAANGVPMGAFPLSAGNGNADNLVDFYWGDTMFATIDRAATVDTWLFYTIERYAD